MPGCGICNPFCGKCKPPMERGLQCPKCGRYYFPEFSDDRICQRCGSVLPERAKREAAFCNYSGLVCAKPCTRSKLADKDGIFRPCKFNKPVLNALPPQNLKP